MPAYLYMLFVKFRIMEINSPLPLFFFLTSVLGKPEEEWKMHIWKSELGMFVPV